MDDLYLETNNGKMPINDDVAKKYHLKKGDKAPFTNSKIVDKNGKDTEPKAPEHNTDLDVADDFMDNGITYDSSEVIDIGEGQDSEL